MKILICEDHKIVRDGLKQILQLLPEATLIEEAKDGKEALIQLNKNNFDILLLDISLPDRSGLEILQSVKRKWPSVNVLILSMHAQEEYAIRSLKLGASGYLTKDIASEELLLAIKKVATGRKYISEALAENLSLHIDQDSESPKHKYLSCREFETMIKLASGKSLQEIARELFISNKTVSTYRSRIMQKMELHKNTDLTRYCLENKLI